MDHKIVDVAPLMEYYRDKLLTDGDDPAIEQVLQVLRELPDYKYQESTSYWISMGTGSKCAKCGKTISKYQWETPHCPNCGAKMISKEEYENLNKR